MTKVTWKSLRAGSWIAITSGDEEVLAQVISPGVSFRIVVIEARFAIGNAEVEKAIGSAALLFGETTDAELIRGNWRVVGETDQLVKHPNPYHVLLTDKGYVVRDMHRNFVRIASEMDREFYFGDMSFSPTKFTGAVRNYFEKGMECDFGKIDARALYLRSVLI